MEIKRYLRAILKDREELIHSLWRYILSIEQANRRRRAVLAEKRTWGRWEEGLPHLSKRELESNYLENKRLLNRFRRHFPRKTTEIKTRAREPRESPCSTIWKAKNTSVFCDGKDLH